MKTSSLEERLFNNRKNEHLFDIAPGKLCAVCNGFVLPGRPLCGECQKEFGMSGDWPPWVKYLVAEREKRIYDFMKSPEEIPFSDIEELSGDNLR